MMPIAALAKSTSPNVASWIGPTPTITASIAPRIALNRVKTLARTISPMVRLVRSPVSLTSPRATRSCTSAAVSPAGGVSKAGGCDSGGAVSPDVSGAVTGRGSRPRLHPDEGDLAGGVVLEHAVARALGQPLPAFVGPDRDQLVAR